MSTESDGDVMAKSEVRAVRVVLGVVVAVVGLYLASWAATVHFHDWWSFPTLMLGTVTVFAGGIFAYVEALRGKW